MSTQPFTVAIPQPTLDDLRERLARTRWPDEVAGAGWDYGVDLGYLKGLVAYWRDGFDWRAQEAALNRFAHFKADVDGLGLHLIHERGRGERPLPLVLLHGWPGSFWQMTKLIPLLADGFDVVVPSLPGYGFSDRPSARGESVARIAARVAGLMTDVLGYERFAIRAGDLGAGVAKELAFAHPERVVALHLTGLYPSSFEPPEDASPAEQDYFRRVQAWSQQEGAYAMEQATKPQTLAVGLNDSPAGLAAWIVEKFRSWSDCEGPDGTRDVERRFSKDDLLTNLTIYWATGTIGSSARLYKESMGQSLPSTGKRVEAPTAFAEVPKDLVPGPREYAERDYNVVRWTELPRGGHFAEWEEPQLIADDLRAFFGSLR